MSSAVAPAWRVRLLGDVSLHDGQLRALRLPSRAATALLARLALAPERAHSREELIELLWPGVDLDVGRNRLRQVLSTLKTALEAGASTPVISADRQTVRVAPGTLSCDAVLFEAAWRGGRVEQARALYRGEALFNDLDYADQAGVAVLALETRKLPPAEVAAWVAAKCGVEPSGVQLVVAPTASLAGSVQIAARVVETGLHKMHELGYDLAAVQAGIGTCPLAPVAADDLTAIGRTNDAVLYGGRAWYTVDSDDATIEAIVEQLPSSASRDYGTPFGELFKRYDGDFYKIDPMLFSPAEVALTSSRSGRTFRAGAVDDAMIAQTLLA